MVFLKKSGEESNASEYTIVTYISTYSVKRII